VWDSVHWGGVSPQTVSKIARELYEKVEEFLNKPVEKEIPYLFVDASYYNVRDEVAGRYKTKALLTVVGIRSFPTLHWKRIKTTNILERVSKELKRRSRVAGAFPNESSLIRLAVAMLIDMNEERLMGRRYLDMEESSL